MPLTKQKKKQIVETVKENLEKQKAMVFVNFSGLKFSDLVNLRKKLREAGAKFIVVKKTLAQLAFKEKNLDFPKEKLGNEIALIFGFEDEIAPVKTAYQFSQEQNMLKLIGGYISDGTKSEFMSAEEVIALAQLPSKQELFAKLVGTLSAPVSGFVTVQRQLIKGLMCVLEAIAEKQ
ncbi:50S ribosomal protein L10 [Patescibacteria group bacterium]|nr:50S ribosomal protein L10 [Patescibacteria group bacterium]MBU4162092.1 50S ribosomal protein L10 [Patescibacteria group bacterium]